MNSMQENLELFQKIMTLFEQQFGSKCEIVLHDLTKHYDHTIIAIKNGHITGRTVGDCGSNLGLEVIRGTVKDGDNFNYITHTRDGKILRSSSIFFHNDAGDIIGALCVNSDITETVQFEQFLSDYNNYHLPETAGAIEAPAPREPVNEFFAKNVGELVEYFLNEGQNHIGKPFEDLNRNEKLQLVKYLDDKGVFLITKAGERVCEVMGISKFTLYNYLDIVRKDSEEE